MWRLEFPFAFPSLNEFSRLNRWERKKRREALAWDAWTQLVGLGLRRPFDPLEFAYVYVRRFSAGRLDPDSVDSCAKHLLDVLQPPSLAQPSGLGLIRQDNDRHIKLSVEQIYTTKGNQRTIVLIAPACLDDSEIQGAM